MTPTTRLAGQLGSNLLLSQKTGAEGKFMSADSPTSEYASGNFPSLAESDRGYASMPSMEKPEGMATDNSSLEKPVLITAETSGMEMDVDHGSLHAPRVRVEEAPDKTAAKIAIEDTARLTRKVSDRTPSETSSLGSLESNLSPAPLSMLTPSPVVRRSESPVPTIAENIEISTEGVGSPSPSEPQRQEGVVGVASKRSAAGLLDTDYRPSSKNPRLSPETAGELACSILSRNLWACPLFTYGWCVRGVALGVYRGWGVALGLALNERCK